MAPVKSKAPSQIFEDEFSEKNLVMYDECRKHYEGLTPDQLVREMDFLLDPQTAAIPFGFSGRRYYAFWDALVQSVAHFRDLSDRQRSSLVNMAIFMRDYVLERTAPESRGQLEELQAATLDYIAQFALFPKVAELIANNINDYEGRFEIGAVGKAIEKRPDGSFVLSGREAAERLGPQPTARPPASAGPATETPNLSHIAHAPLPLMAGATRGVARDDAVIPAHDEEKLHFYTFAGLNGELPSESEPIWKQPFNWEDAPKHLWLMPSNEGPGFWMAEYSRSDLRDGMGYAALSLREVAHSLPEPSIKDIQPFLICEIEGRGVATRSGKKRLFASARIVRIVGLFDDVSIALGSAAIWERALDMAAGSNTDVHRQTMKQAARSFIAEIIKGKKLREACSKPDPRLTKAIQAARDYDQGRIGREEFRTAWEAGTTAWQSLEPLLLRRVIMASAVWGLLVLGLGGLLGLLAHDLLGFMGRWSSIWAILFGAVTTLLASAVQGLNENPEHTIYSRHGRMLLAQAAKRLQYFLEEEARWDEIRQQGWAREREAATEVAAEWTSARDFTAQQIYEHVRHR